MDDPSQYREFRLAGPDGNGRHPYVNDEGAFLGPAVPLLEKDASGRWAVRPTFLLEKLLSVGYGGPVRLGWRMGPLGAVCRALDKGDLGLAAISLLHAQFPPLPDDEGVDLIARADGLFAKFDPDQPRVPAGSPGGGQWTAEGGRSAPVPTNPPDLLEPVSDTQSGGGITAGIAATMAAVAAPAATTLEGLSPAAIDALGGLAAGLSAPVLGGFAILYPSSIGGVSSGTVPGSPDISYRFSEGYLTLYQTGPDGQMQLLFSGRPDLDGIYRAPDGTVFARLAGSSFTTVYGPALMAALAARKQDDQAQSDVQAGTNTDNDPKLCPDEGLDWRHGDRGWQYQQQITHLQPGFAIWLNGVAFDGCRTTDGTMLEAKGPGYAWALKSDGWPAWYKGIIKMQNQMVRQSEAAVGRMVEWHVAEPEVAAYLSVFAQSLPNVNVIYTPMEQ